MRRLFFYFNKILNKININYRFILIDESFLKEIFMKIESKIPFAFSRWGDGEWLNIRGIVGKNIDGNQYFNDLGIHLKEIVNKKQDYYLGAQDYKLFGLLSDVRNYKVNNWHDADIFHKLSMKGRLNELIQIFSDSYVVYVGNSNHAKLNFINEFVEIPINDSWLSKEEILNKIKATFSDQKKIYLFSAGMATNVFIDTLWKENSNNTYIDVGSVFDPVVGIKSRSYQRSQRVFNWNYYKTDKVKGHGYEKIFEKYLQRNLQTIVEFGSRKDSSLLWSDYFPYATVFALDLVSFESPRKQIKMLSFDMLKKSSYSNLPDNIDVVIEDGPHTSISQLICLEEILPKLNNNGVVIFEDLHCTENEYIEDYKLFKGDSDITLNELLLEWKNNIFKDYKYIKGTKFKNLNLEITFERGEKIRWPFMNKPSEVIVLKKFKE